MLEAFLSYWRSWYTHPSGREDGINSYVFLLDTRLAKGKKLPLGPLYLGLLYVRLDDCTENITHSIG